MILNISEAITACNKLKKIDLDIGDKYLEKILKSKKEEQYKSCDDKTLIQPDKEEIKQPSKQAVHCKTKEEWDFVSDKIGYKFMTKFELRVSDTINPALQSCECKSFYERRGEYQLLSFQEWCDLNGYKMGNEVKFEVGDWVVLGGDHPYGGYSVGDLIQVEALEMDTFIAKEKKSNELNSGFSLKLNRHATPEEINNHLISIGQIPVGEPLNNGIKPNKDGMFKYKTVPGTSWSGGTIQNHLEAIIPTTGNCYNKDFSTSYIPVKLKMTLSIDDEELPMVSIIKTNTIKQLLNND